MDQGSKKGRLQRCPRCGSHCFADGKGHKYGGHGT